MYLSFQDRKISFRRLIFLHLLVSAIIGFNCSELSAQENKETDFDKTLQVKVNEEDLIHPGDVIDINIVGSYDYDWRGKLNPEGFLSGLSYVDEPVYGLCQSEESVALSLEKSYSKILKDPKVTVKIVDRSNRPAAEMLGAIKNQQRFRIRRTVFLNELLILSGGLTEKASGDIQIFRPPNLNCAEQNKSGENVSENNQNSETKIIKIKVADLLKGDKDANPKIYNGDLMTILTSEPIYVIGGVQNPKQIPMREKITLSQAINSAGGISKNGLEQQITIFRREDGQTKIIEASFARVKDQPSADFELKAYDIVEVGQKGGGRRKYPPVIQEKETTGKNISSLPLRIIE